MPLIPECNVGYSMGNNEDKSNYGISWQPLNGLNARPEYFYRDSSELHTYPYIGNNAVYGGGGYVLELKGDIPTLLSKVKRLQDEKWIDKYTRAVFVDFTIYNAQVNLFAVVTYLAEFMASNAIDPYYVITPMNLLGYGMFYKAFQFIFIAIVAILIFKLIRGIYKQKKKFFKSFWSYVDILTVIFCVAMVATYLIRTVEVTKLTNTFAVTSGDGYMNFQYVAYWDAIYDYMVGFTEFLATIKFIRLLRFNKYMNLLALTLQFDARSLVSFTFVFFIVFGDFVAFFYLIYNCYLTTFLTYLNSMMTCFQMLIGKFNYPQMEASNPVIGPLIFFLYNCIVFFFLVTMFQSILMGAFANVRQHVDELSTDRKMMSFMANKFMHVTGIGQVLERFGYKGADGDSDKAEAKAEGGKVAGDGTAGTRTEGMETLERLPDVIDRLMGMLGNLGTTRTTWDSAYMLPLLLRKGNTKDVMHILEQTAKSSQAAPQSERRGLRQRPNAATPAASTSSRAPSELPDVEMVKRQESIV
jgi:polycystin 1L2